MKLIGILIGLVSFVSSSLAGPLENLQTAASNVQNGVVILSSLPDESTTFALVVDDEDGYICVLLAYEIVAAGFPTLDEDGVYVLSGESTAFGAVELAIESGVSTSDVAVSLSLSDTSEAAWQWRVTNTGMLVAPPRRCVCYSTGNGNVSGACTPKWCDRMTVVCARTGSTPSAWCEWR